MLKRLRNAVERAIFDHKERIWLRDLAIVTDFLDRRQVRYWIDGGNLLALVRDGRFLPNRKDNDVDVSMDWNLEQFRKVEGLRAEMEARGLLVHINYFTITVKFMRGGALNRRLRQVLKKLGHLHFLAITPIHISLFRRADGCAWNTWMNMPGADYVPRVVPEHLYDEITHIEHMGVRLPIPARHDEYLELKYGADWRQRRSKWTYYQDDGTIDSSWVTHKDYQGW